MAAGRRPGEPCRRQLERWQACWCGWRAVPRRCLQAHLVDDKRTPVAALGDVAGVAEALHQLRPGSAHALGAPAGARRLAGEPVARHRRDHHVERVRCARAMCRGIGQRIDDLQLLDDRAGPAVRDDQRQASSCFERTWMKWMSEPVDLGDELRQGVELRLDLAPVVVRRPVAREFLIVASGTPCDWIRDGLLLRPVRGAMRRRRSSSASSGMSTWKGRISGGLDGAAHDDLPGRLRLDQRSDAESRRRRAAAPPRRRSGRPCRPR